MFHALKLAGDIDVHHVVTDETGDEAGLFCIPSSFEGCPIRTAGEPMLVDGKLQRVDRREDRTFPCLSDDKRSEDAGVFDPLHPRHFEGEHIGKPCPIL